MKPVRLNLFALLLVLSFLLTTVSAAPRRPLRLFPFVQSRQQRQRSNNNTNKQKQQDSPNNKEEESKSIRSKEEQDCNEHEYDQEHHDDSVHAHHHHSSSLLQIPSCSIEIPHNSRTTVVTTIVDTGAQVTVLSAEAARRCGVAHFMDQRYSGQATGVGNCRVLGRIPAGALLLKLSPTLTIPSPAITVLDNDAMDMDLLLGLDFLGEHQAILNIGQETMMLTHKKEQVTISFARPLHHIDDDDDDDITMTGGGWINQDLLSSSMEASTSRYDDDFDSADEEDNRDDLDMSGL